MKTKLLHLITVLIFLSPLVNAQDSSKKVNCYGYVKLNGANSHDSLRVKQGHWIEKDTFIYDDGSTMIYPSDGPAPYKMPQNLVAVIYTSEGNYLNNMRNGLWQVVGSKKKLVKKIWYSNGYIQKIERYDSFGNVYNILSKSKADCSFETYSMPGKLSTLEHFSSDVIRTIGFP